MAAQRGQRDLSLQPEGFIVYALPRSRTKWLSTLLTYDGWTCGHEVAFHLRHPQDIREFFMRSKIGTVETAAGPARHLIEYYCPLLRVAVVRRPLDETAAAMIAAGASVGIHYDHERLWKVMAYGDRCLTSIAERPGVLTLQYSDLDHEAKCKALFEHCLQTPFNRLWWLSLKHRNVQVNLFEHFAYYLKHKSEIEIFKQECKRELIRLRRSGAIHA